MNEDDLTLNEPVTSGWLRAEYAGDEEAAKGYLLDARQLLGGLRSRTGVNARLAAGEPGGFYRDSQVLPDGTRIEVWTNDGHDTVRITAPPTSPPELPGPPEAEPTQAEPITDSTRFTPDVPPLPATPPQTQPIMRSYCINEADAEVYTAPLYAERPFGPMLDKKESVVFMGGWIDGPYIQTNQAHLSAMYSYDPATLGATGSGFELPYPPQSGFRLRWDEKTDTFLLLDQRFSGTGTEWGIVAWSSGTGPGRIALPSVTSYPGRLYSSYSDHGPTCINGYLPLRRTEQGEGGAWVFDTNSQTSDWTGPTGGDDADGALLQLATTAGGDVLAVRFGVVSGIISEIARYGTASGRTRAYPLPPSTDSRDATEIVSQNDDETLWLLQTTGFMAGAQRQQVLSRFDPVRQSWSVITVDGGLGVRDPSGNIYPGWLDFADGLLHDPVTDAVAVLMTDGSGAWIFNAVDCLDVPLDAFFYPFNKRPDAGAYPSVRGQQFYDGQLLVRYDGVPEEVASGGVGVFKQYSIGALYTIGLLQQTRVDEYAGEAPV